MSNERFIPQLNPLSPETGASQEKSLSLSVNGEVMVSSELTSARQRLLDALELDMRLRETFESESIPVWINTETLGFRSQI